MMSRANHLIHRHKVEEIEKKRIAWLILACNQQIFQILTRVILH
jgi:hypothetical protein